MNAVKITKTSRFLKLKQEVGPSWVSLTADLRSEWPDGPSIEFTQSADEPNGEWFPRS